MAVPEAAVDKDNGFVFGEDHVGFSGERFYMEPKPKSHSVEDRADAPFRIGVLAANAGHVPTAALFCQTIFVQEAKGTRANSTGKEIV